MMELEVIKSVYPDISERDLYDLFPRLSVSEYPSLAKYSWEEVHEDIAGQGGLFLAHDMAELLDLREGMKVLDLGCGRATTSVYLASEYGVEVHAVDKHLSRKKVLPKLKKSKVENSVLPQKTDAWNLRFPKDFFDAVFSMNAYFYFGTDDFYLGYLSQFVRDGGKICIGSPCYAQEINSETPKEFLIDPPAYLGVHSPDWWRSNFEKNEGIRVLHCERHPKSREFWLDAVRWIVESCHPREMDEKSRAFTLELITMVMSDTEGFVTHFKLLAEKSGSVSVSEYL